MTQAVQLRAFSANGSDGNPEEGYDSPKLLAFTNHQNNTDALKDSAWNTNFNINETT